MKKLNHKNTVYLIGAAVLLLALVGFTNPGSVMDAAANLIISFENFRAVPYWDVNRYSWGYGTAAPGASGTITEEQARADLEQHIQQDYDYLQPLITRALNTNQWAALLSFAYNTGDGNADNLVDNINSGDDDALQAQWMLYNKAGGVYNANLAQRRAAEWKTWIS